MENKESIYLAGVFSDWRDSFIKRLSNFDIKDPRNHRQQAIAKLVEDDMNAAQNTDILFAYFPKGEIRGTMTYAEIGASRARGKCIITIDEDGENPLFEKVASHHFKNKENAFELLDSGLYSPKFHRIKKENEEICRSVLFTGALSKFSSTISEVARTKNCRTDYDAENLENFARDVDITVVKFDDKEGRKEAVFYMGLSYALNIPIILCTSNPVIYAPLAGLARRIFTGQHHRAIVEEYLNSLHEQNVESEFQIYQRLRMRYNQ
ncbi:hypothetical protein HYT23_06220 [Candidatus Pacearchaeota archaeon]|nr:hypothetical protein [Candidatus Pacearchaeota archaeon]